MKIIKEHFEDYLSEKHAESYNGCDDNMPDSFESWCGELGWEEIMQYADDWRDEQVKFVAKEVKEMVLAELNNK
jgi:hypothetical protein